MTIAVPLGAGNVTSAQIPSSSSITLTKPANTADGDLLIAFPVLRNGAGTITAPAGWTQLGLANSTNETFAFFYKAIPSAAAETAAVPAGTYQFVNSAGASRATGHMFRVTGINLASIPDASGALAAYTGQSSVVLPAVTAVGAYTLLLAGAMNNNASGPTSLFTAPAGMTTIAQVTADNGTATVTNWVGFEIRSAAGTTGTRTTTISPISSNTAGVMVTINGMIAAPSVVPDQLVAASGWTASSGTVLAAVGDASDATYAESPVLTGSDTAARFGFPLLAASPYGLTVTVRAALDVPASTTTLVKLYQGATLLKTWTVVPTDTITDLTVTASASDLASVTDWSALELEITAHV